MHTKSRIILYTMKMISSENLLDLLFAYNLENGEIKYQYKVEKNRNKTLKCSVIDPKILSKVTV